MLVIKWEVAQFGALGAYNSRLVHDKTPSEMGSTGLAPNVYPFTQPEAEKLVEALLRYPGLNNGYFIFSDNLVHAHESIQECL